MAGVLENRLVALVQRMSNQSKALKTLINGNLTDLSSLHTTAKASLLAAINELHDELDDLAGGAAGIDDDTTSATSTWSSSKTSTAIADARAALKVEILGGAGPAFDTLEELRVAVQAAEESDVINALTTVVGQKANAADVYSKADLGNIDRDLVAVFESGL